MTVLIRAWLLALATATTLAVELDGRPVKQLAPAGVARRRAVLCRVRLSLFPTAIFPRFSDWQQL